MHYLGGLQKYVPMAMAFFAPNVNSYRRLALGEVAPKNVQWGYDNRTCGLRVPMDTPENTRVESRFAGSDANPYLAMAATLACGYLGIERKAAADRAARPAARRTRASNCRGRWRNRCELLRALPSRCASCSASASCSAYICGQAARNTRPIFRVISSWEREFLLLNV